MTDIKINFANLSVMVTREDGTRFSPELTPKEFKLLNAFVRRPDILFTREQLMTIMSPRTTVDTRTVDKHISSLRKKLGPVAFFIQTKTTFGYIFSKRPVMVSFKDHEVFKTLERV